MSQLSCEGLRPDTLGTLCRHSSTSEGQRLQYASETHLRANQHPSTSAEMTAIFFAVLIPFAIH
jgi:hypothetical protein